MPALTQPLQRFLQGLQPRERWAVTLAAAVVGLYLLWAVALAPALKTLRELPARQAQAEQQLHEVRELAQQARALQERQRGERLRRADALRSLEAASRQTLGASARVEPAADRVTVRFDGVGPEALAQWLSQARLNARLLPVESRLQRSGEGQAQRWSGTVVLAGTALAEAP